jgi:hypothetical protein
MRRLAPLGTGLLRRTVQPLRRAVSFASRLVPAAIKQHRAATLAQASFRRSPRLSLALGLVLVAGLSWVAVQGATRLLSHLAARLAPPSPAAADQYIQRQGANLTLAGQTFKFTGFNIYSANSLGSCHTTLGTGPGLDEALSAWAPQAHHPVMRAWFYQSLATTATGGRDWSGFDHTLAVAKAHGVRVVATLADQWGDCDDGRYKTASWYNEGYRNVTLGNSVAYRAWVQEVVARYRDNPTIMAWQLMNEAETKPARDAGCAADGAATLRAFADDLGGLIHATDPHHLTSLGTIGGGQCGTDGPDYQTVHASAGIDLCEYHDYSGTDTMPGDNYNGLSVRLHQCRNLGKPLFIGEVGIKPEEASSSASSQARLQARADAFGRKFTAATNAGAAGSLIWAWQSTEGYQVGPGDPAVSALHKIK